MTALTVLLLCLKTGMSQMCTVGSKPQNNKRVEEPTYQRGKLQKSLDIVKMSKMCKNQKIMTIQGNESAQTHKP